MMKRMKTMKRVRITMASALMFLGLVAFTAPAHAETGADQASAGNSVCEGIGNFNQKGAADCENDSGVTSLIRTIITILSYIIGVASVIMILVGGLKYVTSAGDAAKVKSAKDSIVYALIGLVIVVMAQLLVRYVLTKATSKANSTTSTSSTSYGLRINC